jgi:hypothetical protein
MAPLGRILVVAGCVIVGLGMLLMFSDKIPLIGKLPGDISIKREHFQVYIPITTSILVSVVLSVIVWLVSFLNKK